MVVEEGFDYVGQAMGEFNVKMRDLEDRQRIMRDRLLLIGKNLLEFKKKTSEDVLGIKFSPWRKIVDQLVEQGMGNENSK